MTVVTKGRVKGKDKGFLFVKFLQPYTQDLTKDIRIYKSYSNIILITR